MKRNISKLLIGVCLSSSVLMTTGCIEETFPTNAATEDQVTSSEEAASAMLWSMHAMLNSYGLDADRSNHYDWGYGSVMHVRDVMTGDMAISSSGYDHYWPWEENVYQGESYIFNQFVWNFYWRNVLAANKLIGAFPLESASDTEKGNSTKDTTAWLSCHAGRQRHSEVSFKGYKSHQTQGVGSMGCTSSAGGSGHGPGEHMELCRGQLTLF